ncbi:hypothetical protein V499_08753 [Pseudogymnoascus sp. VKM F-103]|nr:hypothetical protein V499_08753 [Pseudogymnoascus sp. VKM F-103]
MKLFLVLPTLIAVPVAASPHIEPTGPPRSRGQAGKRASPVTMDTATASICPPPEEKELVHPIPLLLVRRPTSPRRHGIQDNHPPSTKAKKDAHDQVPRCHAAEIGEDEEEVEVHGQQGEGVQLVALDGLQPLDLGIPVVGKETNVAGTVVSETGEELGGGKHEAGVEEPAVERAEAIDDGDG